MYLSGYGSLNYTYNILSDNGNERSIKLFSTNAHTMLYQCVNCPYKDYQKFVDYYGEYDYANQFITAAYNAAPTSFVNGNADFSTYVGIGRVGTKKKKKRQLFLFWREVFCFVVCRVSSHIFSLNGGLCCVNIQRLCKRELFT